MAGIPDAVVQELAPTVASALPSIAAWIPPVPAAVLGRLGVPEGSFPYDLRGLGPRPTPAGPGEELDAVAALQVVPAIVAERLLGSLELYVPTVDAPVARALWAALGEPPSTAVFTVGVGWHDGDIAPAVRLLEQLRPGAAALVTELAGRLAGEPAVAAELLVPPALDDEGAIAAAHGRAYLALGVVTASALLDGVTLPDVTQRPAVVVGVAIAAATTLLRRVPMPPGYAAALLAKLRAEYLLPRSSGGSVPVTEHRFAVLEGDAGHLGDEAAALIRDADFAANGLAVPVPGGVVIRTGVAEGDVRVLLRVVAEEPPPPEPGWDEVVELSWRAGYGAASVVGPEGPGEPQLLNATPPWPGDYRVRVHARDRDEAEPADDGLAGEPETYELVVWQAPEAPPEVHRRTDRLGHRLRGEPEPPRAEKPEFAYRWIRRGRLREAATITVVTGAAPADVLRAFGADPDRAEPAQEIAQELSLRQSMDPWMMVAQVGEAVLAVEDNGWQGAQEPVLRLASAGGRAASMYWNVNGVTRLSFAERGRLLADFEPPGATDEPAVLTALAGLDFEDYRDLVEKGLVAVERFTGHRIGQADVDRVLAAGVGFRIVPQLPELYVYPRPAPGRPPAFPVFGPLAPATETLLQLPEQRLRDIAWWSAAEAARHAGLDDDPDVAASLEARALTPRATHRARRSQLDVGDHYWLWMTLHQATNTDPVAAVAWTVDAACNAVGTEAADLLDHISKRLTP